MVDYLTDFRRAPEGERFLAWFPAYSDDGGDYVEGWQIAWKAPNGRIMTDAAAFDPYCPTKWLPTCWTVLPPAPRLGA